MPLFPEEKKYNIVDPIIKWLPEERHEKHYSLDQVQMMTDHARRESIKNMHQFSWMKNED
jgi:hypothetical protein